MDLTQRFEDATARANALPTQGPQVQLELYGLYKQATQGDATGKRPGMLDVRRRAKFDAWASRAGMSTDDAKEGYISAVGRIPG